MATLVLGALGTLVGGPIGGAIGALLGRQVDTSLIGSPRREGPRLKELAVSTSSYGQPIARIFGRTRVAGSIIWATDLAETQSTSGGGRGKPKVTNYSYSSSFVVALSSRPVKDIGRIWADGQLIRGSDGALKAGGTMRLYRGHDDQPVDPLIASATGNTCPAFRGLAYVVFEDLQLADFGNRIPALSFEVLADDLGFDTAALLTQPDLAIDAVRPLPGLDGFEHGGGTLRDAVAMLSTLYPVVTDLGPEGVRLQPPPLPAQDDRILPMSLMAGVDDDFGRQSGQAIRILDGGETAPSSIRYYDPARDYQPGVQRSEGRASGDGVALEIPAVMSAATARSLLREAHVRAIGRATTLHWRLSQVDPAIAPGACVKVPGQPGRWMVTSWEWRESGVELVLERVRPTLATGVTGDAGEFVGPPDLAPSTSWLRAFELPLDGPFAPDTPRRYLAVSASGAGWSGAELLADAGAGLVAVGASGRTRATVGTCVGALPPSPGLMLERGSTLEIDLLGPDMQLRSANLRALAFGANRLLIGGEIIQFLDAIPVAGPRWRLTGLLRAQGGTEAAASLGHPAGSAVVLLDDALIPFDQLAPIAAQATLFAAIGMIDVEPPTAVLENAGLSLRPLCPVHGRANPLPGGGLAFSWSRRARGAWSWADGVDVPLIEQTELYRVGAGLIDQPLRTWQTGTPALQLSAGDLAGLPGGTAVWVRQIGSHALSDPLLLTVL